jgi:hypothetical protein
MDQGQGEPTVRRLVTGYDDQGRSVILSDTTTAMAEPLHELWVTDGTPLQFRASPDLGALPKQLEPPAGGTVFRFLRIMPTQSLAPDALEEMYAQAFSALGASHTRLETSRHPAMHKTHTLDYAVVLSGSVKLLLDEGEQELKPFDVVIQRGTNHGWINDGPEPALMAFVLIDKKA